MAEELKVLLEEVGPWEWPRDLDHRLLAILRDKNRTADPAERLIVVQMAGDMTQINDPLSGALMAIVENAAESEEMRAKAAISFGAVLERTDLDGFDDPYDEPLISEPMFERIKRTLKTIFLDAGVPKLTRRRILEGSIRAPEEWHTEEIRKAYASDDPAWKLTAVFCMNYVRGFDKEILESLESEDEMIHYQAVRAAGSYEVDDAWPHIAELARSEKTEKELRIAAIEALSTLKPQDSLEILHELSDHEDEDIADAADEARTMAVGFLDDGDDDDEDDEDDADYDDSFGEKPDPLK